MDNLLSQKFQSQQLLFEKYFADSQHPMKSALQRLLFCSDFACQKIPILSELIAEDDCQKPFFRQDYNQLLSQLSLDLSEKQYASALRNFRHRALLRVYLRELATAASTEESLASWSDCADALIMHCLAYCQKQLSSRFGQALDDSGKSIPLLVLAMGKLGGRELNFSSDVDLIFSFPCSGQTDGRQVIDAQSYFSKVIQHMVQLLQNITAEGLVFRVDLRLRPNGESGPLVLNYAAMETYYQEQGRDWERYAMVKARVINPEDDPQAALQKIIRPFVYKRYVDFSVLESLRGMKALIEREVLLKSHLDDIKRGRGGIREIEFIIQNAQLIRGGRLPKLQVQNAMAALAALKKEKLLQQAGALRKAYLFLRRLENSIQMQNDRQTHTLPDDPMKQLQLAIAMHMSDWPHLQKQLAKAQKIVRKIFHTVLKKHDKEEDEPNILLKQLANLWHGFLEESMAVNLLESLGYHNPARCYQLVHAFRHGARCRRLSQAARIRLERFMVVLLTALADAKQTDEILLRVMQLLDNIVGRSAYLALLTENPYSLQELFHWFQHSDFVSDLLIKQPFLLEILLDQSSHWRPLKKRQLAEKLRVRLLNCPDSEAQEEALRQFKLTQWLLAARASHYQSTDVVSIGYFLTDTAEVILEQLFLIAADQLAVKYPEIAKIKNKFAILAYGKAGSQEMGYQSDLDLVFVHCASVAEEHLVTRLTQKIVHMLTTRYQSGILYAVDTRLRPSGSAGLLVSHFDAFKTYQQSSAWTWEHQSLIKARMIIGNRQLKQAFSLLKAEILTMPRDKQRLSDDIIAMRHKINQHQIANPIKHASGGLLDLEFLIQYLVLSSGCRAFAAKTQPLQQLEHLQKIHVITEAQKNTLIEAYYDYHQMLHAMILGQPLKIVKIQNAAVKEIMDHFFPNS